MSFASISSNQNGGVADNSKELKNHCILKVENNMKHNGSYTYVPHIPLKYGRKINKSFNRFKTYESKKNFNRKVEYSKNRNFQEKLMKANFSSIVKESINVNTIEKSSIINNNFGRLTSILWMFYNLLAIFHRFKTINYKPYKKCILTKKFHL